MPPRTRQTRAAAKKQQQYRIDDGSDEESSKDSKKVGGVLAAISQNVPTVQPSLVTKDLPPVSSVEIKSFKKPVMSPLAASHSVRGRERSRKSAFNDEISAISCDLATKTSVVSEDDDDQTKEMEMLKELDNPDISDAEVDADQYDREESESEGESEPESEDEDSDVESEVEEEEDFAPDDDDYVPDEDDDSVFSEDEDALENFTEQEPEYQTPIKKKSSKSKKSSPDSPVDESTKETDPVPSNNMNCEEISTVLDVGASPTRDISFEPDSCGEAEELDDGLVSEATEVEPTPMKKTQFPQLNLLSPEPQVAVVLDDDDDDFDDDVLIATIVEDDIMENSMAHADTNAHVPSLTDAIVHSDANQSLHPGSAANGLENEKDKTPHTDNSEERTQKAAVDKENMAPKQRQSREGKLIRGEGLVKRGKWTLGTKIGVGSFGSVHVGMNNATGKLMAVKLFKLDGAVMKDIRTEVELMRSLDHPNIVRYLGAQMDDNNLHIFQEWVPGGSVATLLSRFGPFPLPVIRSYLLQTLEGLLYLHNNNIMHRDIKGSNILVNDEGVVKLADFGASKRLANLGANLMMSLTVRGTPYFMAPEVFEEKYSSKADVWGVGCVAYQMITGSPPWKDRGFTNPISLFNHIKQHPGPPPTGEKNESRLANESHTVWTHLNDLLKQCFAKHANERPTVEKLLHHKFFDEMPFDTDDESTFSRGLFSPVNAPASKGDFKSPVPLPRKPEWTSPSPARRPSPQSTGKSKSVVKWKQTFLSPPRSSKKLEQKSASPWRPSPTCSPQSEPSEWPEWARAELQKRNLFAESSPEANMQRVSAMMGSLALSESGGMSANNARGTAGRQSTIGTTATSNLVGLRFLDESSPTVEI